MTDLVVLEGQPEEVGRSLGELWAADLVRDTDQFFARMEGEGLEASLLLREARAYEKRLAEVAPHMLVELAATAESAGVPVERFLATMGLKYTFPERVYRLDDYLEPAPHACTSFMAVGAASGCRANLLHKNRDSRQVPQAVHIKQIAGKRRVLGAGDVGDLGLCHALNADGLAGKTNSGDRVEKPLRHAISTTEILRLVIEECATCEQALDLMKQLARAGLISNGTGGCIWLFADRERGLIVEEVPFKLDWRFVEDTVEARANRFKLPGMRAEAPDSPRYDRAIREMRAVQGGALPTHLNRLGRDTEGYPGSICNDGTNSTTTSVLPFDPSLPPYWEMAVGHPNNTLCLPISPVSKGVPRSLVDGSLWRLAARLHERNRQGACPGLDFEMYEARFRDRHTIAGQPEERDLGLRVSAAELEGQLLSALVRQESAAAGRTRGR